MVTGMMKAYMPRNKQRVSISGLGVKEGLEEDHINHSLGTSLAQSLSTYSLWSRNRSMHTRERSESAARESSEMSVMGAATVMMVQRRGNVR
jgi:hypothetical protein